MVFGTFILRCPNTPYPIYLRGTLSLHPQPNPIFYLLKGGLYFLKSDMVVVGSKFGGGRGYQNPFSEPVTLLGANQALAAAGLLVVLHLRTWVSV